MVPASETKEIENEETPQRNLNWTFSERMLHESLSLIFGQKTFEIPSILKRDPALNFTARELLDVVNLSELMKNGYTDDVFPIILFIVSFSFTIQRRTSSDNRENNQITMVRIPLVLEPSMLGDLHSSIH